MIYLYCKEQMDIDITYFLPKYPNISNYDRELLNPYEDNFYENIYKKKEFLDEKLERVEKFPENAGDLMNHQKIIARFFSSYTMYDHLLLLHDMGTGKTCSSIGAIETLKNENNSFTGAMIFAKGEGILNNFKNELVFKCTNGIYIPEDYELLTEGEKIARINKNIKDYYSFYTFETFGKDLHKYNDDIIIERYSNKIIVIDEVHNLRIQDRQISDGTYYQFHRFLHIVKNCKILLMSGTPMKDGPEEIASIMNLMIPITEQLPVKEQFILEYLNEENNIFLVKPNKINMLKSIFKGRVSYLKAMQSQVEKVFEGERIGTLRHFNVISDNMSDFQTLYYNQAYMRDETEKGVYAFSRQAILFVYPDGTYGPNGFEQDRYIKKTKRKQILTENVKEKKLFKYSLGPVLKEALQGNTNEEKLNKLSQFSSKYASTIRSILEAEEQGKSSFVYCEFVTGSGSILFASILELFDFSKANGTEAIGSEKKRYCLITNKTATQKEIKMMINRFNQPDNMFGKIINIIIGSKLIGEGFSLKNVQCENILTPHWNYSETSQAIARGLRLGSHKDLIENDITPIVKIYQRVSLPSNKSYSSIDLEMYQTSEIKDINIKKIEKIMKESAFDCALNYERNYISGFDGERECDYEDCNYICDGINNRQLNNKEIDYSTYNLYYSSYNIKKIIKEIINIFTIHFRLDLNTLINYFPNVSNFELITALRTMINESTRIINKYGFSSYLKEENNIFFLVDSLSVFGNYSLEYYTRNIHLKKVNTFSKIIDNFYLELIPNIISEICVCTTLQQVQKFMIKLPLEIQEIFLESSILSKEKNINFNINLRNIILEYFKNYYKKFNDVWVSWLLFDDTNILRCMENLVWKNCTEEYIEILQNEKQNVKIQLENNKYGYYGIYNRELDEFCIRDVSGNIALQDKRKIPSGKRCLNWSREALIKLIIETIKLDFPDNFLNKESRTKLWTAFKKNKYLSNIYTEEKDSHLTNEDLRRGLYWSKQYRGNVCNALKQWFLNNGLIEENNECGIQTKKKK
jgi:superfamily II DNA or RNA helicase